MRARQPDVGCANWHCRRQCMTPAGCRPCCFAGDRTTAVIRGMYLPVRQTPHASRECGCSSRGHGVRPDALSDSVPTGVDRLVTDRHAVRETDCLYLHRTRRLSGSRGRGMAATTCTSRFREVRKRQPFLTTRSGQRSGRRNLRPGPEGVGSAKPVNAEPIEDQGRLSGKEPRENFPYQGSSRGSLVMRLS